MSPIEILMAPSASRDLRQALELLERLSLANGVRMFAQAAELVAYVASAARQVDTPPPRLVLIDLSGQPQVELTKLLGDLQPMHHNLRMVLVGHRAAPSDASHLTDAAQCVSLSTPINLAALLHVVDQHQLGWVMVTNNPGDSRHGKPLEVLLVDDSSIDAALVRGIFKRFRVGNDLRWIHDGDAALAFLRGQGVYGGVARPGLVLLDLNMPGKSGWDVLQEIKGDASLRTIPVAIHSVSEFSEEIERAESLGACCFLVKPISLEKLLENTARLGCGWVIVQP